MGRLSLLAAVCVLPLRPAQAQSPEDRYVKVYGLIEEADRLKASGQGTAAVSKYLEAQVALKGLQQAYPDWNGKLVAYRLGYIASCLEPLTKSSAPRAAPAPLTAAPSPADESKAWQDELARLSAQNALLQAKLREALTVQPSAVDPRELAKAEEKIKRLQKERDLLSVTLEQNGTKPADADTPNGKQALVTQAAVAGMLRKQNEELLKQIADLSARLNAQARAAPTAEALALKETIAGLEASNKILQEEQVKMENRLKEFVRQQGQVTGQKEADLEKQLAEARQATRSAEKERDDLIAKLNAVSHELNQRDPRATNAVTQELERQLEGIRARLRIFEAKNVPYTAEELALFKQPPLKVAPAQSSPPAAAPADSHAATAALLDRAMRAIDTGHLSDAEQAYREALQQDGNNGFLLTKLAAVQMDQDKVAEAEGTLRQALQINSQDPVALYLLGGLKLRQEKYDEALEALSLSAKLDPDKAQTHYFLGQVLIQQGSRGPAETELRRALQLKPGWGDAHYLLAVLYATQEPSFKELAQYHYNQAVAGGAARNYDLEKALHKGLAKP